jgi:hypothetical protein
LASRQPSRQAAYCVSLQEAVWGTALLERLLRVKKSVDPRGLLNCHRCVGEVDAATASDDRASVDSPVASVSGSSVDSPASASSASDVPLAACGVALAVLIVVVATVIVLRRRSRQSAAAAAAEAETETELTVQQAAVEQH